MSRETFLSRVREATERGRAYRIKQVEIPAGVGYVGAEGDLCQKMADEVLAVGGEPEIVADWQAARQHLVTLLQQYQVRSAICWQHDMLRQLELTQLLTDQKVTAHHFDSLSKLDETQRRETLLAADIGITSVTLAIAETGTLMVASQPGQERVASLLPPVHVAIVSQQQIVPDLIDALATLNPQQMPSNVSLITGPSKTGDIELQLTTGVHGPGKWHVLIVRETV